jgi:hypothetical protein
MMAEKQAQAASRQTNNFLIDFSNFPAAFLSFRRRFFWQVKKKIYIIAILTMRIDGATSS